MNVKLGGKYLLMSHISIIVYTDLIIDSYYWIITFRFGEIQFKNGKYL